MFVLLPGTPPIDFVTLAAIFVSAILLGFASHAPGGIGVFDAAMFAALSEFDKEELLAGLLLFRMLYYIVPLALSLLILGIREIAVGIPSARFLGLAKQIKAVLPLEQEVPLALSAIHMGPPVINGGAVQCPRTPSIHGRHQQPGPL
jgi:hypothetical protein